MCYTVKSIDDVRSLVVATRGLSGLTDIGVLAAKACRRMHELTGADFTALALVDESSARTESLTIAASVGIEADLAGLAVASDDSIGWRCLRRGMATTVGDCAGSSDPLGAATAAAGICGLAAIPLTAGGNWLGVLYAGKRGMRVVPRTTLLLNEFAASLAPLIVTARRAENAGAQAVEAERQRIAQDLHDTVGQILFKISMASRELRHIAHEPEDVAHSARVIETDAAEASAYLRQAMGTLMPSGDALPVTIRRDVAAFGARTGIATELAVFGSPRPAPPEVEGVLLSVTREALHNVEKHAGADAVFVSIAFRSDGISLVIEDDGKGLPPGFRPNPVPGRCLGLGIPTLIQKVSGIAGSLKLHGNDDGGTTVQVLIPWGAR
ncbi:MAG: histidine kinase [Mycobacterium sp.]